MPRAENRKRPPSMGNAANGGVRNKSDGIGGNANQQTAHTKKQELLDKMKKMQQSKKEQSASSEDA